MCVLSLLFSSVSSAFSSLPPLLSPQLLPLLFFSFLFFCLCRSPLSLSLASYPPFPLFSHPLLPSLLSSLLPFFSFAFVVSTVSTTSFPLFFCRSFRLFRFSRFLPLLLPSHLPSSGFFCSFHLFLSLLFKSPVNFACSWYLSQLMSPLSTSFVPKLGQS